MSLEGTVAGLAGALRLGGARPSRSGSIPPSALLAVVDRRDDRLAAESLLGATLEAPGILNNDMLNFLNTAIAAAAAIVVAGVAA